MVVIQMYFFAFQRVTFDICLLQAVVRAMDVTVYFNRYVNVKLFQIQAASDEFFLPDSEVIVSKMISTFDCFQFIRIFPGMIYK